MLGRLVVSAMALTGVAYAEQTPTAADPAAPAAVNTADRTIYEVAFFAQFSPQTALDMVRQTPGFTLNGGDGRRGFSGAVGNLLVDGVRPTSKSQSLEDILSRIPLDQVLRIEVLRGAAVAGDASGQSVLVNVVRTPGGGSGVWMLGAEYGNRPIVAPQGNASYSGRSGLFEYGIGGAYYSDFREQVGARWITDAVGAPLQNVDIISPREHRNANLSGNVAFPLAGGRLSANGQVSSVEFDRHSDFSFAAPDDTPLAALLTDYSDDTRSLEFGVNYDRDFGPWSLALISLINRSRYDNRENGVFLDGAGAFAAAYTQQVAQDSGETILRASLSRPLTDTQRIEFGGEGALNTLDQSLSFVEDDGSGPSPVPIPNSNVSVEERRAELFGAHTWRFAPNWSLESRLAWETSTLQFSGDSNNTVELAFWKPSLQISRSFAGGNQLRLRVYRDVGQLDFNDFVSAAEVADNLIAGGNPDLAPQTDWRVELGGDLHLTGGAALQFALTHHAYEDVADLVTLVDTHGTASTADDTFFDAPGNIGEAEATSLTVTFTTPLTAFIPGGSLILNATLWDTDVRDPLTGRPRIISQIPESDLAIDFRQDINSWGMAWGWSLHTIGETQSYRFNEISTDQSGPYLDWFVEYALPYGVKLNAILANTAGTSTDRDRRFFDPDRNGAFLRRERSSTHSSNAPWFILQVSGTF